MWNIQPTGPLQAIAQETAKSPQQIQQELAVAQNVINLQIAGQIDLSGTAVLAAKYADAHDARRCSAGPAAAEPQSAEHQFARVERHASPRRIRRPRRRRFLRPRRLRQPRRRLRPRLRRRLSSCPPFWLRRHRRHRRPKSRRHRRPISPQRSLPGRQSGGSPPLMRRTRICLRPTSIRRGAGSSTSAAMLCRAGPANSRATSISTTGSIPMPRRFGCPPRR